MADSGRKEKDLALVEEFKTVRAVTADGRSVQVPKSKFGGNLEVASDNVLGGIKAESKTEAYTKDVRIDPNTGKLFVEAGEGTPPDDEDITIAEIDGAEKLRFKDKKYNSASFSGLGRCYLRRNIVNGQNILTQAAFNNEDGSPKENTRYIIQYDYDLNGATINVPKGAILEFQGGSIDNGTLAFHDNSLFDYESGSVEASYYQIFGSNLNVTGSFKGNNMCFEWFGAKGNYTTDDTGSFRRAIKAANGKGLSIRMLSGKSYYINGTLNFFDNEYHDITNIAIIGGSDTLSEPYPSGNKRPSCLCLNDNISLFKNATVSMTLKGLSVKGSWINWFNSKVKFFDSCILDGSEITSCSISYIYCMFYETGIWSVTRIHNNNYLGVYNFSIITGNDNKASFVDSEIYNNYINGGAPNKDKFSDVNSEGYIINNRFFTWKVFNGSRIYNNFVDYYCVMYEGNSSSTIVSTNNEYQVFQYFHKKVGIVSFGDVFNWNDPNASAISEVMGRYQKDTYQEGDSTYTIPSYIASDRYYSVNVVFKDMVIEKNIKCVVYRTGFGDAGASGTKFIVRLHDTNKTYTDGSLDMVMSGAISYPEGKDFSVYGVLSYYSEVDIDRRLATVVDSEPTDSEYFNYQWGKVGVGEYLIYDNTFYKVIAYNYNGRLFPSIKKYTPENVGLKAVSKTNVYILGNELTIGSDYIYVYPSSTEDRYLVRTITITDSLLMGRPIILSFAGKAVFEYYQDVYGNKLTVDAGDVVTLYQEPDGTIRMSGYYKKDSNLIGGKFSEAPTYLDGIKGGALYYCSDIGHLAYYNALRGVWVEGDGKTAGPRYGTNRTTYYTQGLLNAADAGLLYFDTSLTPKRHVVWEGSKWVELDGSDIS